jgi:hypothetical protein
MNTGEETFNLSEIQDQKANISTLSSFNNMTHHSSTKTWEICTQQPETDFSLAATHLL